MKQKLFSKYEKEVASLRLDISDMDNQLQEANTNRDREVLMNFNTDMNYLTIDLLLL